MFERLSFEGPAGRVSVLYRRGEPAQTPVVFLHGINGSAEQWVPVMDRMPGRTVVAIDSRGHGQSDPGERYRPEDHAADVRAVLNQVDADRAHLVGASFGGSVAITVAAADARVRSVTVVGGALTVAGQTDADAAVAALQRMGSRAFFTEVAAASFAPGTDPNVVSACADVAARADVRTVAQVMRDAFAADVTAAAAEVRVPSLVLTGELDTTCPPKIGAALAEALRTRCHVLPGRGHMAHLEDAGQVAAVLDGHLRRHDAPAAVPGAADMGRRR